MNRTFQFRDSNGLVLGQDVFPDEDAAYEWAESLADRFGCSIDVLELHETARPRGKWAKWMTTELTNTAQPQKANG